jgi:alkaline phosphatase D
MKRRDLLGRALSAAAAPLFTPRRAPAFVTADAARPSVEWGAAVGDVTGGRALVWSRTDRPARLVVEYATTEAFRDPRRVIGPAALEDSDFTARVDLEGLPAGQRIFYRALFQDLSDLGVWSAPVTGSFATPSEAARDVSFVWGGDVVGQGWGINREWGGLRMFERMRRERPTVLSGDAIYADNPLAEEVKLDDGTLWQPRHAREVQGMSLEFRGVLQPHDELRRLTELTGLCDDHGGAQQRSRRILDDPRYRVKAWFSGRAGEAGCSKHPIRPSARTPSACSGRSPTVPPRRLRARHAFLPRAQSPNRQTVASDDRFSAGSACLAQAELRASHATWKGDRERHAARTRGEGWPHRLRGGGQRHGPALGRELEIAALLASLKKDRIRNVAWVTADVQYAAAHHFDPGGHASGTFDLFWEFVAGPLHAGTFTSRPSTTPSGPRSASRRSRHLGPTAPSEGVQFYGRISDRGPHPRAFRLAHDLEGRKLFGVDLQPEGPPSSFEDIPAVRSTTLSPAWRRASRAVPMRFSRASGTAARWTVGLVLLLDWPHE